MKSKLFILILIREELKRNEIAEKKADRKKSLEFNEEFFE